MKEKKSVKYRIGMMIHDFEIEYSKPLMDGVGAFCEEHDIECMYFLTRAQKWTYGVYDYQYYIISQIFNTNNLDGLVIISTAQCMFISKDEFAKVIESFKPLPVASIGVEFKNALNIIAEQKEPFKQFLRHLVEKHGRRRLILLASTSNAPDIVERENVFFEVCKEYNIPCDETRVFKPAYDLRALDKIMNKYKTKEDIDFDAVITLDDKMALGCLQFLIEKGVSIPEDVIVTGFDDTITASMADPRLSTISQQLEKQGYEAASSIYAKLTEQLTEHVKKVSVLPLYRQSCGCLQKDDIVHDALLADGSYIDVQTQKHFIVEMRYLYIREEMNQLQYFLQDVRTNMTIPALKRRLKVHLQKFGVKACSIVLFKEPVYNTSENGCELPKEARLFLSFFDDKVIFDDSDSIIVKPYEEMFPSRIMPRTNEKKITMMLFNTQYIYGYTSFVPGDMDYVLYPMIFSAITNSIVSTLSFITKQNEAENLRSEKFTLEEQKDNLMTISRTDELTKLFNRRGILLYGQQNIEMALEMKQSGLIVFGDMDGLKKINDTYGHEAGNRAIQAEAELLRRAFRSADLIGRIGGDEFVIVAVSMDMNIFERVKENIIRMTEEWNQNSGEQFKLSISLGATPFNPTNYNMTELLDEADKAQYEEKRHKKLLERQEDK